MMKPLIAAAALLSLSAATLAADDAAKSPPGNFTVASTDVGPNKPTAAEFLFNGFGCTGKNLSPELHWSGAPAGTQSFAVSVYDPDAPTGSGWWHWYVVNLPATTTSLAQGVGTADGAKLPTGAQQIKTDFGAPGYGGPCPPEGSKAKPHRYIVTVYALKVPKLDLPKDASAALAGFMVNSNALSKATFTYTYGR